MKRIIFCSCLLAAVAAVGMTDTERQYLHNLALRPRCESRTCVVIGGVSNVVEVWRRGDYTWAQTNPVRRIVGVLQENTFQQKLDKLNADIAALIVKEAEWRAKAQEWMDKYQQAVDKGQVFRAYLVEKTQTGTTIQRALAKLILDKYDEIISNLEAAQ